MVFWTGNFWTLSILMYRHDWCSFVKKITSTRCPHGDILFAFASFFYCPRLAEKFKRFPVPGQSEAERISKDLYLAVRWGSFGTGLNEDKNTLASCAVMSCLPTKHCLSRSPRASFSRFTSNKYSAPISIYLAQGNISPIWSVNSERKLIIYWHIDFALFAITKLKQRINCSSDKKSTHCWDELRKPVTSAKFHPLPVRSLRMIHK